MRNLTKEELQEFARIVSRNARVSAGLRIYGNISIAIYDNNHEEF